MNLTCFLATPIQDTRAISILMNELSFSFSVADRSFNDIMQYPVLPWILADYTSSTLGKGCGL